MSVSYTHLDVYKRQIIVGPCHNTNSNVFNPPNNIAAYQKYNKSKQNIAGLAKKPFS